MDDREQPRGIAVAAGSSVPAVRSSALLVLGILSIVFGGLGMLPGFGYGSFECGRAVGRSSDGDDYEARATRDWGPEVGATVIKSWKAWKAVAAPAALAVAALSAALIVVGLGQIGYRKWARRAAILWAIADLAALVAIVVAFVVVVGPAQAEAMRAMEQARIRDHALTRLDDVGAAFSVFGAGLLAFCLAPYPIVLLVLSTRRSVAEVMSK